MLRSWNAVFLLLLFSLTAMLGCGPREKPFVELNVDSLAEDPNTVLELVLLDLSLYQGRDLPLSFPKKIPRNVYVSLKPPQTKAAPQPPLDHRRTWSELDEETGKAVREAISNMIDKGTSETPFDNYMPIFDTIQIVNDKKTAKVFEARYPLEIWPPGYSNDGTVCVLYLSFPDFRHHSDGVYILRFEDDTWKIVARAFMTFV